MTLFVGRGLLSEKKNRIRTGQARGGGGSGRMILFVGRGFLSEEKNELEQAKLGAEKALDGCHFSLDWGF